MPRGKKAKRKRKAQKKAERERRFFNPPQSGSGNVPIVSYPVLADQCDSSFSSSSSSSSYEEEEYIPVIQRRQVLFEVTAKTSVGVPEDTTTAVRSSVQITTYRHIGIQTDIEEDDDIEEKVDVATSPLSSSSSTELPESCAQQTAEDFVVGVRAESTTEEEESDQSESVDVEWTGDGDSSDSAESFEVRVQDLLPLIENPPIDALAAGLHKIMNFDFELKDVRERKNVNCDCYAGEKGKPSAREKYQEIRMRRVSHRIQHMRRSLGSDLCDARLSARLSGNTNTSLRDKVEWIRIEEEMRRNGRLTEEEIRKYCELEVEESVSKCPLHRKRDGHELK